MYKSDDTLVLSASDLTGFLACGHLTELDRAVTLGNRTRPERAPGSVAAKYGNRHEEAHLRRLQEQGRTVATIARARASRARVWVLSEGEVLRRGATS